MRLYTGDESGLVKSIEIDYLNEKHEDAAANKRRRMKIAALKNVSFKKTNIVVGSNKLSTKAMQSAIEKQNQTRALDRQEEASDEEDSDEEEGEGEGEDKNEASDNEILELAQQQDNSDDKNDNNSRSEAEFEQGNTNAVNKTTSFGAELTDLVPKIKIVSGKVEREKHIDQLVIAHSKPEKQLIAIARRNGNVELVDTKDGLTVSEFNEPLFSEKISIQAHGKRITEYYYIGLGANQTHFASCTNLGNVRYQKWDSDNDAEDEDNSSDIFTMKLDHGLTRMKSQHNQLNVFAVGGYEQDLRIFDINKVSFKSNSQSVWKSPKPSSALFSAKNLPHDYLGLREPVWITDLEFLNRTSGADTKKIVTSTGYGQIRLYDTKASNRPVLDLQLVEGPINCIALAHNERDLYFADSRGGIFHIDLNMGISKKVELDSEPQEEIVTKLKTVQIKKRVISTESGAMASLAVVGRNTHLAAVGLNRKLKVFRVRGKKNETVVETYLKQKMTCVLWDSSLPVMRSADGDESDFEGDFEFDLGGGSGSGKREKIDTIWNGLEVLQGNKKNRKRMATN